MIPPVLNYPLDLTGSAPSNLVQGEEHTIAATGNRAIALQGGPFYTRSLVVRNKATGTLMVPDRDFRPVHLFVEGTQRSMEQVCSVLLIPAGVNVTQIAVDYQVLGGEYVANAATIRQLLESLDLDNRTIDWGDLIDAPEFYNSAPHYHGLKEWYGFEHVVTVLESIRRAILIGDEASHDELRQYIDLQDNETRRLIGGFTGAIEEHVNNRNNPHGTTAAHVGLGNVPNYAAADQAAAIAGTANNLLMTPLRGREQIMATVGNAFNAHTANTNNPHGTTKSHVGLGSVENQPMSTTAQAQAGSGNGYMNATLTSAAITALALAPLNAHTSNTNNPHGTTKTQVGLGSVDNYATATAAQAQAGTATNLFLTPAGGRALVEALVGTGFAGHVNNTNNPHNTTKAHVGLGNVENFRQVRAGTNGVTITWTGAVAQLIIDTTNMGTIFTTNQPDPNLQSHLNNGNNPHGTNKSHVGLGNVDNFATATQAQAEAGNANAFMTSVRTAQAIQALAINPLQAQINNRIVNGSNAHVATIRVGNPGNGGYLYQDADASMSMQVAGARFFQFHANGSFICHNGPVIAGGGFQPSDRRLKTDIHKTDARPLWRGLGFHAWKMKADGKAGVGVLAGDLRKIAPDRTFEFEMMGEKGRKVKRLSVDYAGSAFEMAFAAGQQIDVLTEKLAVQNDLIGSLLKRLAALEAKA